MERFVAALGEELSLTSEDIADILWLAVQIGELPQSVALDSSAGAERGKSSSPKHLDPPPPKDPIDRPTPESSPPPAEIHLEDRSSNAGGLAISVPDARSLREPLELARSLKPLLQQVARGWSNELDEAATIDRIVNDRLWLPVLKPNLEAWLDLVLVVDESVSMQIWQRTISELQRFLAHYGVFRDVRTYSLVIENERAYVRPRLGAAAQGQSLRNPQELIDPSGRRLILVATDCVSAFWRSGEVLPALKLWAQHGSMAIVQMLPEWLWGRSGLGLASAVRFASLQAGIPNHQLKATNLSLWDDIDLELGIKVPVVTLESAPIKTWAQLVAGKGGVESPGFVFDPEPLPMDGLFGDAAPGQNTGSGEERVRRFQVKASPMARQLAMILAAAPTISLPIVRILQNRILPRSQQVHVAEVFLGGLLKPLVAVDAQTNPDTVPYEFMDGAREVLLVSVGTTEVVNVLAEVSQFVAERLGLTLDAFMGVLRNPQETEDLDVVSQSRPFAMVTAQILRQLGGEYIQFAQELEQANRQDPEQDADLNRDRRALENWNCVRSFSGHEDNVTCVAFSPDGKYIVSSSDDRTIRLWDVKEGREVWRYGRHEDIVHSVAFSPDGRLIASASADEAVHILDLAGERIIIFSGHNEPVTSVVFSPDGQLIASAGYDGIVKIWNLSWEVIRSVAIDRKIAIQSVVFSADGCSIIFGGSYGDIHIYNLETEASSAVVAVHNNINSLALNPHNGMIASSGDRTVSILNINNKQLGNPFIGHQNTIWSVSFSPNGKLVASGSRDKTIRLWDLEGNQVSNPLIGHSGGVNCVAFSPDGTMLVSCGGDRKIKFWSKYPANQLPFRKLSDFAATELLRTCNGTDINVLQTDSPWQLPFDAIVIPVGKSGSIGSFGSAFSQYLNSIATLPANSLQTLIYHKMQELRVYEIEPEQPLIFSLVSDISSHLFFAHKPIFIICPTVELANPSVESAALATRSIIQAAAEHGYKNLMFSLIGAGSNRLPVTEIAKAIFQVTDSLLKSSVNNEIEEITIVDKNPTNTEIVKQVAEQLFANTTSIDDSENSDRSILLQFSKDEPLGNQSPLDRIVDSPIPCAVIITSLAVEYLAVRDHISNLSEENNAKKTLYERGEFTADNSIWSIGIIRIDPGDLDAALIIESAIEHFSPDVILFVGIATGIKDVQLGDVVASNKIYGYESGKAEETFKSRPEIALASRDLEGQARVEVMKSNWRNRIIPFDNTQDKPVSDSIPHGFIAPIAIGKNVIASTKSDLRQFIRSNYSDAVAIEMEGFAFLEAVRVNQRLSAMVIRGISDLSNRRLKIDDYNFQRIAARHASAFAFQLLSKFDLNNDNTATENSSKSQDLYPNKSKIAIYHRLESASQTIETAKLQEKSLEIRGGVSRNPYFSNIPQVKALIGSLPKGKRGIEFTTDVPPELGNRPGFAYWSGDREELRIQGDVAILKVLTVNNFQN